MENNEPDNSDMNEEPSQTLGLYKEESSIDYEGVEEDFTVEKVSKARFCFYMDGTSTMDFENEPDNGDNLNMESMQEKCIQVTNDEDSMNNEDVEEVTIYIEAPNSPFVNVKNIDTDSFMMDTEDSTGLSDGHIQALSSDAVHKYDVNDLPISSHLHPEDVNHYCPHCLTPGFTFHQLQDHVEKCGLKNEYPKTVDENGVMFLCNTCSIFFPSEMDLENHMKLHDIETFKCTECRMVLTSEKSLKRHMRVHTIDVHKGKGFPCAICGQILSNRGNLTRHMSTHYEEGDVEFIPGLHACIPCKKNFISKILLIKHLENHRRAPILGKNFICNECGASFVNQGNLGRHMLVHSGEKEFLCPICDYKTIQKATLQRHVQTHKKNEESVFPCEICGEKYTEITLKIHKLKHKYNNSTVCTKCGKKFSDIRKLNKHMKTHNNKEIVCIFCGGIFTSRTDYNKHMDMNHQDKFGTLNSVPNHESYSVCLICYKIFDHLCILKIHMRTHNNDNKYSCTECQFSCRKQSILMLHLKSKCDTSGVYKCKTCERVYYNKQHLLRHMVSAHTDEKPYECSECDYKSSRVQNLHSHLQKVHYKGKEVIYKFGCLECLRKFASEAELDQHIHNHKIKKECPYCDYTSKSSKDMKKHEQMCKLNNEYISCPECKLKFKSYLLLENHIASVHTNEMTATSNAKPFCCEYCNKYFKFNQSLKKHIRRHHSPKVLLNFEECDFQTSTENSLEIHIAEEHEDSLLLKCEELLLKCEECDFKASSEDILEIHIAEQHEDCLSFPCSFCKFTAIESSNLKKHIEKEHPEEVEFINLKVGKKSIYSCPDCEERFNDRNLLKKHLISKHL